MDNQERLEALETKMAYQEKAVKELNDVIYDQQRQIDHLVRVCEDLMAFKEKATPGPANEKPPHY